MEPKFDRHFDSRWRRVVVGKGLSLNELLQMLGELDALLKQAVTLGVANGPQQLGRVPFAEVSGAWWERPERSEDGTASFL